MGTYLVRRFLQLIPVLVVTSFVVFLILRLVPGDPAQLLAGPDAQPEQVAAVRKDLGLDRPIPVQYALWAGDVLKGDFGRSYVKRRPVSELIRSALPATIELTTTAVLLAALVGVPFGIVAGLRPNSPWDLGLAAYSSLALGIPNFLLAILYLLLFALTLGWLPAGGRVPLLEDPGAAWKYLVLPTLALGLPSAAVYSRFVRSAMIEVASMDYIRTARAKGLAQPTIVRRHALRNAMLPLVTVLGVQFGRLLGGAVVIESIFAWPGMGRLALDAIRGRDYVVFQGVILLLVLAAVLINLLTDLLYGVLDPRIRLSR
jgi:ABC-type dipeptide/oligopeptide/nickel transport system permease component